MAVDPLFRSAPAAFAAAEAASAATAAVLASQPYGQHVEALAAGADVMSQIVAVHRLNERFAACRSHEEAVRLAGELRVPPAESRRDRVASRHVSAWTNENLRNSVDLRTVANNSAQADRARVDDAMSALDTATAQRQKQEHAWQQWRHQLSVTKEQTKQCHSTSRRRSRKPTSKGRIGMQQSH